MAAKKAPMPMMKPPAAKKKPPPKPAMAALPMAKPPVPPPMPPRPVPKAPPKPTGLKATGTYKGKSNAEGGGGRFAQMVDKLKGKVEDPAAVAASIGRKSKGKAAFQAMATAGKKRAAVRKQ